MEDYSVIDKVSGDTLEPGDFVLIDGEIVELLSLADEDEFRILNHSTGDDDIISLDPNSYYALLGG
jgi:hypothetical protein